MSDKHDKWVKDNSPGGDRQLNSHPYYAYETTEKLNKERLEKDAKSGQQAFDFLKEPEKDTSKQDKAKAKAAENEDFKDKRQPKSDLIRQAELEKMKEILNKPKSGGGGGGGSMTDPMERKTKPYNKAKGGIIKSASKRADGCAIRGKTRA